MGYQIFAVIALVVLLANGPNMCAAQDLTGYTAGKITPDVTKICKWTDADQITLSFKLSTNDAVLNSMTFSSDVSLAPDACFDTDTNGWTPIPFDSWANPTLPPGESDYIIYQSPDIVIDTKIKNVQQPVAGLGTCEIGFEFNDVTNTLGTYGFYLTFINDVTFESADEVNYFIYCNEESEVVETTVQAEIATTYTPTTQTARTVITGAGHEVKMQVTMSDQITFVDLATAPTATVNVGDKIKIKITYTYDATTIVDGLDAIAVFPHNCWTTAIMPDNYPARDNVPVDSKHQLSAADTGCATDKSVFKWVNTGFKGVDGTTAGSYETFSAAFPVSRYRGVASLFFQCDVSFCFKKASKCYNGIVDAVNTCAAARRKRDAEDFTNQTNTVATGILVLSGQRLVDDNYTGISGSDKCFQNTSFLIIFVLLLILLLVAVGVGFVLCYKLSRRRRYEDKQGVANPSF